MGGNGIEVAIVDQPGRRRAGPRAGTRRRADRPAYPAVPWAPPEMRLTPGPLAGPLPYDNYSVIDLIACLVGQDVRHHILLALVDRFHQRIVAVIRQKWIGRGR